MHSAGEIARLGKIFRSTKQHGGVPVMAARMHAARILRAIFNTVALLHRQRVHIGPQSDGAVATGRLVTAADHADDAGTAEAAMHLDAPLRQPLRYQRAGALLLEANLRM